MPSYRRNQAANLKNTGAIVMAMMSEFKEFAVKGNVMDLAVGVIIGAAFGKSRYCRKRLQRRA